MTMPPVSLRTKLSLVALLAAALGVFALIRHVQRQRHDQAVEACRLLRVQITDFKRNEFDAQMQEMRAIRLNETQAEALRNADADAYARYAAAFGQVVDQAARTAENLGDKVNAYQRQGCLDLR